MSELHSFFELAEKFHTTVNSVARRAAHTFKPRTFDAPPDERRRNITTLYHALKNRDPRNEFIMASDLVTSTCVDSTPTDYIAVSAMASGKGFVEFSDVKALPQEDLWRKAVYFDSKGIIPRKDEHLDEFVFRANTTMAMHRMLRSNSLLDIGIEAKDDVLSLNAELGMSSWQIPSADIEEANAKIPYGMDLSWLSVRARSDDMLKLYGALGVTFTIPSYDHFSFLYVRDKYPTRKQYMDVLAHEMTHAGTVALDIRSDYLETKAYAVGKGSAMLGEYVVAINISPPLWMSAVGFVFDRIPLPTPDFKRLVKYGMKVHSWYNIKEKTIGFREVQQRLTRRYGDKGNYILGRLDAEEMGEMRETNNIAARVALKDDLKWRIMKEKLS